jgi:shikimate kinase
MKQAHPENSSQAPDRNLPPAVFLVGFMGAGKTSVGRELARRLGWNFVDLDDRIVARESRSVAEIFRDDGEAAFRWIESRELAEIIAEAAKGIRAVIALGGGAYVQPENAVRIRETRIPVVFLDASLDELRHRCSADQNVRPLFQDEAQFRTLYESRHAQYLKSDARVDTTGKSVEAVAAEIALLLTMNK